MKLPNHRGSLMKKRNVLAAALTAVSLLVSGLAFAQPGHGRSDRDGRPGQSQRGGPGGDHDRDRDGARGHQGGPRADRDRGPHGNQGWQNGRPPPHAQHAHRGAGPNHNFHRGGRLSHEYRGRQYVVNDWRGHRLSAPPRGYHWVQTGGDYVLVAISSGIILQIYLGQ